MPSVMVDLTGGGPEGPIEHGFNNWVFVFPGIVTATLISFFAYKLVQSLRDKEKRREDKKKQKQQKKEVKKKSKWCRSPQTHTCQQMFYIPIGLSHRGVANRSIGPNYQPATWIHPLCCRLISFPDHAFYPLYIPPGCNAYVGRSLKSQGGRLFMLEETPVDTVHMQRSTAVFQYLLHLQNKWKGEHL